MEIIGCGRGHFYNPNEHSSCPQCAKEGGNMDVLSVTEPVDFGKYAGGMGGGVGSVTKTEPLDFDFGSMGGGMGSMGGMDSIGATEAVEPMSTTDFVSGAGMGPMGGGSSKVQDYGPTAAVSPVYTSNDGDSTSYLPVVGWLVCIEGAAKGRDYRIHSQYNYIGRAQHMDICISGDDCISADKAAILAYDDQEKFFSFGPGMGHNVVRVNGKMLMNAVALEAYDELTIGKTKLLFVPLCGERFDWNEK